MTGNSSGSFLASDAGFYLLVIAAVGDLLIPFLLAPFCDKYNHMTMVMSLLGNRNTPVHGIYNTWLVLAGILFLLGNLKLYALYAPTSGILSALLFCMITVYALGGCILSGLFSVGETKELLTVSEQIHGYGSVLGFSLLAFTPLLLGLLSIRSGQLPMGIMLLFCFVLAVGFFAVFVMADKEQFAHTIISKEGLWQRLSLLCMYVPIVSISLKNILR